MSRERDLIRAIDKRAEDRIRDYEAQHTIEVGIIKGLTLAGASVQLSESGRFLRNVPRTQGIELVVGANVLLARVTRRKWVIIGALEADNALTPTTANTVPVAGIQDLVCEDRPGYMEIRWTASYFQIECYEVQVNTSASEEGATTFVTDNTQFMYINSVGTYYARVRAVGPNWDKGSWSAWTEGGVTTAGTAFLELADTPETYAGYSDNILIVNAEEDALEYLPFKLTSLKDTPGSLSGQAGLVLKVNEGETAFEFGLAGAAQDLALMWAQVVDQTVIGTDGETTLFGAWRGSKVIAADSMQDGTMIRLQAWGYMIYTGTPTLTVKCKLNATEICSSGAVTLDADLTDAGFHIEVLISCRSTGVAGAVASGGRLMYGDDNTHDAIKTTETEVNTTQDLEVDLTVTWGGGDADDSIVCQQLVAERFYPDRLPPSGPSAMMVTV